MRIPLKRFWVSLALSLGLLGAVACDPQGTEQRSAPEEKKAAEPVPAKPAPEAPKSESPKPPN